MDDLIEQIMKDMPESWDSDESAEWLCVAYVRALEARLVALGGAGALERYPEDADGAPLPDPASDAVAYAAAVTGARA